MRELWYSDKRDLVKWGAMVQLVQEEEIDRIIQVAFFRETERPRLRSEGKEFPVAQEVWTHFRDLRNIEALGQKIGVEIVLIDHPFDASKRLEYLELVRSVLRRFGGLKKIVLLDPDTGIEPKKAKPEHVTVREIEELWEQLSPGDWLALYQHQRRDQQWREKTLSRFADACRTSCVRMFSGSGPAAAKDVVLFATKKV